MAILDFLSKPFSPDEGETEFLDWYSRLAEKSDINPDPDDPRHYYDYRAAYEEGADLDERRHLPSRFKHDLHPNRFITHEDGIYDTKYEKSAKIEDKIISDMHRVKFEEFSIFFQFYTNPHL